VVFVFAGFGLPRHVLRAVLFRAGQPEIGLRACVGPLARHVGGHGSARARRSAVPSPACR
jgi:hypothetical protein